MIVYALVNRVNGKVYIGQTRQALYQRLRAHRYQATLKNAKSHHLHRAIAKHGWDNFEAEVLEECEDLADLDSAERFWIATYGSLSPAGYNLLSGGGAGWVHSAETRKKMSEAKLGWRPTPDQVERSRLTRIENSSPERTERFRQAQLGRKHSDATKAKIGENWKGRTHSPEARAKMSESQKGSSKSNRGERHGNVVLTWETVREIRTSYGEKQLNQYELASLYNVSQGLISQIVRNKLWIEQ